MKRQQNGLALRDSEKFELALGQFKKAAELETNYADYPCESANCDYRLRDQKSAKLNYLLARKLNEDYLAATYQYYGCSFKNIGEYELATEQYESKKKALTLSHRIITNHVLNVANAIAIEIVFIIARLAVKLNPKQGHIEQYEIV